MQCEMCGAEMKQIPAGVSRKTGKPYDAFMACPNKCKATKSFQTPNTAGHQFAKVMDAQAEQAKWDKVAEGKCRTLFAVEAYKSGKQLTQETMTEIHRWTAFAVGKNVPPAPKPEPDFNDIQLQDYPTN